VSRAAAATHIAAITRETMRSLGIRATILRVDTGTRPLLSKAFGTSMAGVSASRDMHFRIGSMAIPHLITLLLQLEDEGRLSLDDKLSTFLPGMPDADRITLRMLANNTSGYPDWIQGNQSFVELLLANVFKQWTVSELLAHAFARGPACDPGTCFNYAHTNYAVLSKVISTVTGRSIDSLMHERIFKPLGLRQTAISRKPAMPGPVLHAYSSDRGPYEDSTFWSPSWTIGAGTVMSATIGDVARTARAVGTGALISRKASQERFAPTTVGMGSFTSDFYFGLGIIVADGWYLQNPMLNGYTGAMAYLPGRRLSVAIVTTTRQRSAGDERAYATLLFTKLSAYLAPGHPVVLPS
jgi:D-alanyl-D-alanine carboxypeptidase